jgi:hypothetical protein
VCFLIAELEKIWIEKASLRITLFLLSALSVDRRKQKQPGSFRCPAVPELSALIG